jgi:hypothetical protein
MSPALMIVEKLDMSQVRHAGACRVPGACRAKRRRRGASPAGVNGW